MFLFDETIATPLCIIMGNNKSDKGNINITYSKHNYTTFYDSIFKDIKYNNINIFELGLGTNNLTIPSNMGVNGRPGASLYGWSDYFINAHVYGADIDKDILFQTDRINTFYCDQTNVNSINLLWNNLPIMFDIIIEDGLHNFNANVCFFENSIHKLNKNGYYIIEDIKNTEIPLFEEKINEWKNRYNYLTFNLLKIKSTVNFKDNNLLVVNY